MTKILFHSLTIPPDKVSTGMLVAEIASGFKDRGVDVEILASTPQYNFDSNINNKVEFKRISRILSESSYKDVRVIHINSKKRSYSDSKRILQWFRFHYHSIKYLFKNRSEYSHIFLFSYPPTMNLVGIFISKFLKIKLIYSYWELYPEIAEQIDRVKNKLLLSLFKSIDTYALNNADSVVLNSKELEGYMKRMVEKEGHYAEQCEIKEVENLKDSTSFECGLFAAHLAGLCIEQGIDVSYNLCKPGGKGYYKHMPFLWYDKEKKYATVHANMSMGYGKYYRHQWLKDFNRGEDKKPEMEDVVKWIKQD